MLDRKRPVDVIDVEGRFRQATRGRVKDGYCFFSDASSIWALGLTRGFDCSLDSPRILEAESGNRLVGDIRLDDKVNLRTSLRGVLGSCEIPGSSARMTLASFEMWGKEGFGRLLGDFSFVVGSTDSEIYAVRDRFGMKPLFFIKGRSGVVISNDAGVCLQLADVERCPDERGMASFLLFGHHQAADQSITAVRGLESIRPGEYVKFSESGFHRYHYWRFDSGPRAVRCGPIEEVLDGFSEVFSLAVQDRLVSARPVISLSGGVDSALVASFASEAVGGSSIGAITLCGLGNDEWEGASEVARSLRIVDHERIDVSFLELRDPNPARVFPMADPFPARELLVSRYLLSSNRNIVIGAFAADNLFACDQESLVASLYWSGLTGACKDSEVYKALAGRRAPVGLRWLAARLAEKTGIVSRKKLPQDFPAWLLESFSARTDAVEMWHQFVAGYLGGDGFRGRMHWHLCGVVWDPGSHWWFPEVAPLEVADPFLDLRVVEFVAGLSSLPWLASKRLIRVLASKRMGHRVGVRPKIVAGDLVAEALLEGRARKAIEWKPSERIRDYVDVDRLVSFADDVAAGNGYLRLRVQAADQWLNSVFFT